MNQAQMETEPTIWWIGAATLFITLTIIGAAFAVMLLWDMRYKLARGRRRWRADREYRREQRTWAAMVRELQDLEESDRSV